MSTYVFSMNVCFYLHNYVTSVKRQYLLQVSSFEISNRITGTTITLQWKKSPILTVSCCKHQLKYKESKSEESTLISKKICKEELKEPTRELAEEWVQYTISGLSPNTTYQFKLSVVNELGMEGEDTEREGRTGKINANTYQLCTLMI